MEVRGNTKAELATIEQQLATLSRPTPPRPTKTVREAFEIMYYLDCACQIQVDAMAGGLHNVQLMSDQAAKVSTDALQRPMRPAAHKDWPALLRMLERRGIKYAQ